MRRKSQEETQDALNDKKKFAPKRSYRSRKRKSEGSDEPDSIDSGSYDQFTPVYAEKAQSKLNRDFTPLVSPLSFGMPDFKSHFNPLDCGMGMGMGIDGGIGMSWMRSPAIGIMEGVVYTRTQIIYACLYCIDLSVYRSNMQMCLFFV